jgi:hypothetical protein
VKDEKGVGWLVSVGVMTLIAPAGTALADTGSPYASCMGIEASALSPPGSSDEAPVGMPDIREFLKETAPGVPPGHAFYSIAGHLHEGSHEACDEALE